MFCSETGHVKYMFCSETGHVKYMFCSDNTLIGFMHLMVKIITISVPAQ